MIPDAFSDSQVRSSRLRFGESVAREVAIVAAIIDDDPMARVVDNNLIAAARTWGLLSVSVAVAGPRTIRIPPFLSNANPNDAAIVLVSSRACAIKFLLLSL